MAKLQISDQQWQHVRTIGNLHNSINFGSEEQSVLNEYVIKHEKELTHSIIVEILLENVELTEEFFSTNAEYVEAIYRIAKEIEKEDIDSLRSMIRIEAFFIMVDKSDVKL